jgi:hypothetical protein
MNDRHVLSMSVSQGYLASLWSIISFVRRRETLLLSSQQRHVLDGSGDSLALFLGEEEEQIKTYHFEVIE